MLNHYQFMVPRLNGQEIRSRFSYYRSLVRRGIAGFIIFGGDLETVREYVRRLQKESELPLIISSDLERGLGQQLSGGTDFPPPMAIASALRNGTGLNEIRRSFRAVAEEAAYAGINAVYAPVLDINTNPKNPIIAVRAFGEDERIVSLLGVEMIRSLQKKGIAACGKHFPGHGDTAVDSHIKLPVLDHSLKRLKQCELRPFAHAVKAGVRMIMLGHLSVPALDPSGTPVSFSKEAVRFLRKDMGYKGILVTDALNMSGIGRYSEEEASLMALEAGVDILLHPSDPEKVSDFLGSRGVSADPSGLHEFRKSLIPAPQAEAPHFKENCQLSMKLTKASIRLPHRIRKGSPILVILDDEKDDKCLAFENAMKNNFPGIKTFVLRPGERSPGLSGIKDRALLVAVFSETRAWKGGASSWLTRKLSFYADRADLFISFGSPYLLDRVRTKKMFVYWNNEMAQIAAAEAIRDL
jgi:beta-glucosidase-like glycosyl hydrolase